MRELSAFGRQVAIDLGQRHGFSADAITHMVQALANGHGTMAQFDHPEFGGSGQWMRGGMTMVADMFNDALSSRVAALCEDISCLMKKETLLGEITFQSQSQRASQHADGRTSDRHNKDGQGPIGTGPVSLFVPAAVSGSEDWWPAELGTPTSSGSQNDARYAYFAQARRLAVQLHGRVSLYDTGDHQLSGFSQQQSRTGSLSFESQHGLVDVATLPVVSADSVRQRTSTNRADSLPSSDDPANVLSTIEKLSNLHDQGILSEEEFAAKKKELLSRL